MMIQGRILSPALLLVFLSAIPGRAADLEANATAVVDSHSEAPTTSQTNERIEAADRHLALGKRAYFRGNLAGARQEFDLAIDSLFNAPENLPDHRRLERKLEDVSDLIYRFDLENLGAGQTEEAVVYDQAPIDQLKNMTFPVDASLLPKVNNELQQTASGIPLELSDPVLSYIHFFSTDRGRTTLLNGFRRAGRYKAMIQRVLAEEGVPQELIYLAQAESGFLPRAISSAHAMGMWQFISGTGQIYSLMRTSGVVDERFDPEKATHAAARMLKDLYVRYGDWYLAMAAYNCGPGNVDKAVERTGYADYWELLKLHALPKETSNYVPIIVAMTIMAKNPDDYGLQNIEEDPAIEYDTLHLDTATSLTLVADAAQQPVSSLRDLNPAMLGNVAPAGYDLRIPTGTLDVAQTAIANVPAENRKAWRLHHVASGETLEAIARQYHLTADRIAEVNGGGDSFDEGEVLMIPASYQQPSASKRTTTRHARSSSSRRVSTSTALRHTTKTVASRAMHRRGTVSTRAHR